MEVIKHAFYEFRLLRRVSRDRFEMVLTVNQVDEPLAMWRFDAKLTVLG